ncbi:cyclic GMP-AMP synthase-like receptor [Cataglyphis hispanica]|uniref:cyclic GMP-AMP synthase-like receptor n=1 Tax=Cataglyphis hispanica TaxID=1086592 RepID=UPI0021802073|nr:cyclic GMP-AMP synthase-like receptor [Cataglyphis hispanica]
MQDTNIERYLINDEIFNKINKQFISLDVDDVKNQNQHLNEVFEKLINAMRRQSPLFDKTFQRIVWAGSYYKKTRVGEPEEYDLNFVINLPFKEKDIEFISDCPAYIKIRTTWKDRDMLHKTLSLEQRALRELNYFIDDKSYLNQDKFRFWMEGILSRVANETSQSNRIVLNNYISITIKKTGPAFTLSFKVSGKPIDIDVVPVLAFSTRNPPPKCSKLSILKKYEPGSKYWSAVPKPLNNSKAKFKDAPHRYWRLCFYEFEKDILDSYGRAKPIIRHLKKLRDTQNWKTIASYYIETLCLNELDIFKFSNKKSNTSLFFMMLQKLREAFRKGTITYYWDKNLNLLQHIGSDEMRCLTGRINHIIQDIERTIANDKYAIAKYVLNKNEFAILQSNLESSQSSEPANQGYCMMV